MKYMILTYASQRDYDVMNGKNASYPPEDFAPLHEFMGKLNAELAEKGELVETRGLDEPVHSRRLQLRNGAQVVTDGPYAETQEVLAGYWVVECESLDRATEIAGRLAQCPSPAGAFPDEYCDVRPIAGSWTDVAG